MLRTTALKNSVTYIYGVPQAMLMKRRGSAYEEHVRVFCGMLTAIGKVCLK
jgi:hypothetical protein